VSEAAPVSLAGGISIGIATEHILISGSIGLYLNVRLSNLLPHGKRQRNLKLAPEQNCTMRIVQVVIEPLLIMWRSHVRLPSSAVTWLGFE